LEYEKRLRERLKKMKVSLYKVSPFKKFKAIAISIVNMLFLLKIVRKFKRHSLKIRKNEQLAIYAVNHALYRDWIISHFKSFFTRVLNYETDSFDITEYPLNDISEKMYERRGKKLVHSTVYFLK
jgi:hypothetical protein